MRWQYGTMTTPARRHTLLPNTLACLERAGWGAPRLFIDGDLDGREWRREFGCNATCRDPAAGCYGNWWLSMWELYARDPHADFYALFQDDLECGANLRQYLEASWPAPAKETGYLNLHTFAENEALAAKGLAGRPHGWFPSNQWGRGALALCFARPALVRLLSHEHLVNKFASAKKGFAEKNVDGGLINACWKMKAPGVTRKLDPAQQWAEWVHSPSLVEHTGGGESTIGHTGKYQRAPSYRGKGFDCTTLLPVQGVPR